MNTEISVEGAKYTFVIDDDTGRVRCDRFGSPWVTFAEGTRALIALIHEAIDARAGRPRP